MKKYIVRVWKNRTEWLNESGELHREDGPAIEWKNGDKSWWVEGKKLSEYEFNERIRKTNCEGKVVEIDGIKYKLTKV